MKKFNYEEISPGYYDKAYLNGFIIQKNWHILKFYNFKKNISQKEKILDYGCGPGTFSSFFKKKNYVGIDISKKQIDYAKKKYKKKFHLIDKKIPYKKNTFDVVVLVEIIEHLTDRQLKNIFKEIRRVLKKNGRIILSTPNYNSLWPILEFFLNFIGNVKYENQHINKFTKKKLSYFLKDNNFHKFKITTILFISPFLFFLSNKLLKKISLLENKYFKFGNLLFCEINK